MSHHEYDTEADVDSPTESDPHDFHPIQVLIDRTEGEGIPEAVSDGGTGIETPEWVPPEICRIIRQIRPALSNRDVADLLGYTRSTISNHAYGTGKCNHSEAECGPFVEGRRPSISGPMSEVTDHETMAVTGAGSTTFHRNSHGKPACGRGDRTSETKNRGGERDPLVAYSWFKPCKICFPKQYQDDTASRRIAEIEYELAKQDQRNLIKDWGWENENHD